MCDHLRTYKEVRVMKDPINMFFDGYAVVSGFSVVFIVRDCMICCCLYAVCIFFVCLLFVFLYACVCCMHVYVAWLIWLTCLLWCRLHDYVRFHSFLQIDSFEADVIAQYQTQRVPLYVGMYEDVLAREKAERESAVAGGQEVEEDDARSVIRGLYDVGFCFLVFWFLLCGCSIVCVCVSVFRGLWCID